MERVNFILIFGRRFLGVPLAVRVPRNVERRAVRSSPSLGTRTIGALRLRFGASASIALAAARAPELRFAASRRKPNI